MSIVNRVVNFTERWIIRVSLRARYCRDPKEITKNIPCNNENEEALDIGSGPNPNNFFNAVNIQGVDIRCHEGNEKIIKCEIGREKLPFEGGAFDYVTAFDVVEHVPRLYFGETEPKFPFVELMNEVWRVLKVGGYFLSSTPAFPMKQAFQDPTHVNIITEDTFRLYFCGQSWARIYGFIGTFEIVDECWSGSHYWCLMKKTGDEKVLDIDSRQCALK
ncbi:MAG: class I SAM-dependent methyltransferase [Pseudomonadota bacterium]